MRPETQEWIDDAEYDVQSAKAMLDAGRHFFVVFMCQLAIEKLLKAVIVERQGVVPPKIHNLIVLAERAGLTIPPEHHTLVRDLDNMSVVTRYPDGRRQLGASLTDQRAAAFYDGTLEFSRWLRQELR